MTLTERLSKLGTPLYKGGRAALAVIVAYIAAGLLDPTLQEQVGSALVEHLDLPTFLLGYVREASVALLVAAGAGLRNLIKHW